MLLRTVLYRKMFQGVLTGKLVAVNRYILHSVPLIVSLRTAVLSHRQPASAGISRESNLAQGHDKRDTIWAVLFQSLVLIFPTGLQ